MKTGLVVVERVQGRSSVTRCFSKYPLKFIAPKKAAPCTTDAIWIYSLTYGGGIVSGDCISCDLIIGDGCTAVFTTQASTKVKVGCDALMVLIPDPVTCFLGARYSQKQIFSVASSSSLLLVDWITSGRHENGEKWDFELYKSTNNIITEGHQPLFLDAVLLDHGSSISIAERMQGYQVVAMVVILGPKLVHVRHKFQEEVKKLMTEQLYSSFTVNGHHKRTRPDNNKLDFIASCSVFGPKGVGLVVRITALTTESVYKFLQNQLASMELSLGAPPYHR
uniref:Urease accessory protein D n=1 Tax=Kalanchoe fedtschenkoi TaxID=63787 RepID=A0A7N0TIW0_KALFE